MNLAPLSIDFVVAIWLDEAAINYRLATMDKFDHGYGGSIGAHSKAIHQ